MALSEKRAGEIAILAWKSKILKGGFEIKPKEIRRQAQDLARELNITVPEAAEFLHGAMSYAYDEAVCVLRSMFSA